MRVGAAWVAVSAVGTLNDTPVFRTKNNLLQMTDGTNNWLFDGTNWVKTGLSIPYQGGFNAQNQFTGPPFWTVAIDATAAGTFTAAVGRYYWFTNADLTSTRPVHESDSSAIGTITGAVTNKKVAVYQTPGLWSVTSGSKLITIAASTDNPGPTKPLDSVSPDAGSGPATLAGAFNGLTLYINGTLIGVIAGVVVSGGTNYLSLVDNSPSTVSGGRPVLCDARCTHWNLYASEADGSKVGQFLNVSTPVTQDLSSTPVEDQSPFIDDPDNTFLPIFRPVRNDPPPVSRVLEVHKSRLWRVRNTKPNLFDFTANEEVASGANGNPDECVPGAAQEYVATGAAQEKTSTQLAGAGTDIGGFPFGSHAWANPGNVTSGVSYATVSLPGDTTSSDALRADTFGFAIPSDAVIDDITLTFDALASSPSSSSLFVYATKDETNIFFRGATVDLNTSVGTITVSGAPALWGLAGITATEINAGTFAIYLQAPGRSVARDYSVRNVRIKISYTEALPGGPATVTNTISDIVNEVSFPDQSNRIRGLISHGDALYMGSERQVYPLYGESIDDFALSQVTAFNVGFFGRFSGKSTPHGLAFLSYDRKALLYPSSAVPRANATDALIEFGKPMRNKFKAIPNVFWNEVVAEMYYFGIRNWWVIGFPDAAGEFQTYVYDFNTRAWFQLQRGFTALSVFEIGDGSLILVGGAEDGTVYVIDDQTGTYTTSTDLPAATWRPSLIYFNAQSVARVINYIELEFSSDDLANDITVTFWLDPQDVDNPGTGRTVTLQRIVQIGTVFYRGWFQGGTTCKRVLVEIAAASSQNAGSIRGVKLVAYPYRGITA